MMSNTNKISAYHFAFLGHIRPSYFVSKDNATMDNCTSFCRTLVMALEEARDRIALLESKNTALERICYDVQKNPTTAEGSDAKQIIKLQRRIRPCVLPPPYSLMSEQ